MTVRVCSLCWGTAWERYGEKFAASFARYWPPSVNLLMVTDGPVYLPRGRTTSLQDIQGYREFLAWWQTDRKATGYESGHRKTNADGYSWRHDAVKWMPQALATIPGVEGLKDGDIFVWFDADTETTSKVPEGWVESLLGAADVACLQRLNAHSEIGFYAMRMGQRTRRVLRLFADLYINNAVFALQEWHSAFVWDTSLASEPGLKIANLSPGMRGHVWPDTRLAEHTAHHKGKRKDQ